MNTMTKLTLKTEGDTHIIAPRRFAAPPEAVYRAHTDPKLIQKWLLGPEGWTMPVHQRRAARRQVPLRVVPPQAGQFSHNRRIHRTRAA